MSLVFSPLSAAHERSYFSSEVEPLDRYLREQAGQDIKRRVAQCYVAHEYGSPRIAGYYTLSAGNISLAELPPDVAKRLPRYPVVPVARIGRLAVDVTFRGQRLGAALVWDAASRATRAELGVYALAVDAKDDSAAAFYRHLGFMPLTHKADELFLPIATFKKV